MSELLDPTNDYVFKRLFSDAPDLLADLIIDLRPDSPAITSVQIRNPDIKPTDLTSKHITFGVLARDCDGQYVGIDMQICTDDAAWQQRGLFYLARTLDTHLFAVDDCQRLHATVVLHLLDFDLFTNTASERERAVWRLEMRDQHQPDVTLGNVQEMNLIELNKADRLDLPEGPLRDWVTFFKHWHDELAMARVAHEPVKRAMRRIRDLSTDEETRRLAFAREQALKDEVSHAE